MANTGLDEGKPPWTVAKETLSFVSMLCKTKQLGIKQVNRPLYHHGTIC